MSEWQPIEGDFHPQNYQNVLLWCEKYGEHFIGFRDERGAYINQNLDEMGRIHTLTHWMPLPEPPKF